MTFQREKAQDIFEEIIPLTLKHWREIAPDNSIPPDPDFERYALLEDSDGLRCFTVRDDNEELVGYAVFFLYKHQHSRNVLQAVSDLIFIDPAKRGGGHTFLKWCDEKLKEDGAKLIYYGVSTKLDFGLMLERRGYNMVNVIYSKKVD